MKPTPKGHWPRGKRRHPLTLAPDQIVALLERLCSHRQMAATARRMGVAQKTMWRWKAGIDVPAPAHLAALRRAAERVGE